MVHASMRCRDCIQATYGARSFVGETVCGMVESPSDVSTDGRLTIHHVVPTFINIGVPLILREWVQLVVGF